MDRPFAIFPQTESLASQAKRVGIPSLFIYLFSFFVGVLASQIFQLFVTILLL